MRHLIQEISNALGGAKDEDREELTRLRGAVQGRLEGSGGDDPRGLVDSLERAEIRFEADHPRLAESIRQVIQSLSSAGI